MGKMGHLPPPPKNVVKCFCALAFTAKRSVDELLCTIFTTCRCLVALLLDPTRALSLDFAGDLVPDP